jgi:hypothetical protein
MQRCGLENQTAPFLWSANVPIITRKTNEEHTMQQYSFNFH